MCRAQTRDTSLSVEQWLSRAKKRREAAQKLAAKRVRQEEQLAKRVDAARARLAKKREREQVAADAAARRDEKMAQRAATMAERANEKIARAIAKAAGKASQRPPRGARCGGGMRAVAFQEGGELRLRIAIAPIVLAGGDRRIALPVMTDVRLKLGGAGVIRWYPRFSDPLVRCCRPGIGRTPVGLA